MEIYDLKSCPHSDRNGMYGGNSGEKEGIIFHGDRWIIKYPKKTIDLPVDMEKSYNTSPVSEYIGSHIYNILEIPVHETILGLRNEQIVVACKDLCDDNHDLIEFRQFKNAYNKELNAKLDESITATPKNQHFASLAAIMIHLEYNPLVKDIPGIKERFWNCAVVDGFINNNDRNNGNWGILRGAEGDSLAPVYDNGASFSPNVSEQKICDRLSEARVCEQSAMSIRTAYTLDGERAAFFTELLKANITDLNKAISRIVPVICDKRNSIIDMIRQIPNEYGGHSIISVNRKTEYIKELDVRLEKMLIPAYEKVNENVSVRDSLKVNTVKAELSRGVAVNQDLKNHDINIS